MSYGITPYFIPETGISDFLKIKKNEESIAARLARYPTFFSQLNELFRESGSISAEDAAKEIITGNITRKDAFSGAVYWYVFEKLCAITDMTHQLRNRFFYPIALGAIIKILENYDVYSPKFNNKQDIPFPQPDDFPWVAFIPHDEVIRLRKDFSELNLIDSCHEEFTQWLDFALEMRYDRGSLLLYYY